MKINQISPQENKFLQSTEVLAKKPKALYFIGTLPENKPVSVAIVGSRKPTPYGKEVTETLAFGLAKRGVVVLSGLAYGVDALAHKAALEANGTTIAVLAGGLQSIYPAVHKSLAEAIVKKGGALITEYSTGTSPRPYQFLERNRLISGLADAVIITEAAARSGTLNTAAHALEQGKDVYVVPGNITSLQSQGCNALILQGAQPVINPDDLFDIIAPQPKQAALILPQNPLERAIIEGLQAGIRDGDELCRHAKCSASEFAQAMTIMEINGMIRSMGGNRWVLR